MSARAPVSFLMRGRKVPRRRSGTRVPRGLVPGAIISQARQGRADQLVRGARSPLERGSGPVAVNGRQAGPSPFAPGRTFRERPHRPGRLGHPSQPDGPPAGPREEQRRPAHLAVSTRTRPRRPFIRRARTGRRTKNPATDQGRRTSRSSAFCEDEADPEIPVQARDAMMSGGHRPIIACRPATTVREVRRSVTQLSQSVVGDGRGGRGGWRIGLRYWRVCCVGLPKGGVTAPILLRPIVTPSSRNEMMGVLLTP